MHTLFHIRDEKLQYRQSVRGFFVHGIFMVLQAILIALTLVAVPAFSGQPTWDMPIGYNPLQNSACTAFKVWSLAPLSQTATSPQFPDQASACAGYIANSNAQNSPIYQLSGGLPTNGDTESCYLHRADNTLNGDYGAVYSNYPIYKNCHCDGKYSHQIKTDWIGSISDPGGDFCAEIIATDNAQKRLPSGSCPAMRGNPINTVTGAKIESLSMHVGFADLDLRLTYDTTSTLPANQSDVATGVSYPNAFGALWKSNFHHALNISGSGVNALVRVLVTRGDGVVMGFNKVGSNFVGDVGNPHQLTSVTQLAWTGYRFNDINTGVEELFDASGQLQNISLSSGIVFTFAYSGTNREE